MMTLYVYTGAVPLVSATFGMGSGMIVEHVRCNGTERQLSKCTIRDSHDGQCGHSHDAGVRCGKIVMHDFSSLHANSLHDAASVHCNKDKRIRGGQGERVLVLASIHTHFL